MSAARIEELETQLRAALASIAALNTRNAELTRELSEAGMRSKKIQRNARRDASTLQDQLAVAQRRRP
jgi:hypothetical protein